MKKLLLILGITLPIGLLGQSFDTLSVSFLQEAVHTIETISPDVASNEDLTFLVSELEGVEILLLGEQGHGDGSTFLAKTRIIKYLHENQGYNVLAFESGLFDCYRVWEAIQNGADSLEVFGLGIFPVWAKSEQLQPLFQYILDQSKTDNPLILIGFDMQPTGNISPQTRFKLLDDYLTEAIDQQWSVQYQLVAEVYENTRKIFVNPLSPLQAKQLEEEAKELSQAIADKDGSVKGQLMAQYVINYLGTITLYSQADMQNPSNTPHVFNLRDNQMAKNFDLIKDVLYPGEKILAWGANTHFGYGRGLLGSFEGQEAPEQGMVPAGQYLKIEHRDKLYSMAFTSYRGQSGSLNSGAFEFPEAKSATIEYQLNAMGHPYAFMSLRNHALKPKRFITTIYGHTEMSGKWALMADGVFFIRDMKPSTFK